MDNTIPQDDTPRKQCNGCFDWHPRTTQFFEPRKDSEDGLRNSCRICRRAGKKVPKAPIPEGYRRCIGPCKQLFPATTEYFHRDKSKKDGIHSYCKECANASTKAYYRSNKEQCTAYYRQYREEHKDKVKEKDRRYSREHHEQIKAYNEQYYSKHRENLQTYSRRYNRDHKEEISVKKRRYRIDRQEEIRAGKQRYSSEHKEQYRRYRREHKEQFSTYYRQRRARRHATPGKLTTIQIQEKLTKQHYACYYCHKKFNRVREQGQWRYLYALEHTVPVSRTECNPRHDVNYVVLSCSSCNSKKCNKLPHEWPEGGRLL